MPQFLKCADQPVSVAPVITKTSFHVKHAFHSRPEDTFGCMANSTIFQRHISRIVQDLLLLGQVKKPGWNKPFQHPRSRMGYFTCKAV